MKFLMIAGGLLLPWIGIECSNHSAQFSSESGGIHRTVELRMSGDLAGKGHTLWVEWYLWGPLREKGNRQDTYVRGVALRDPANDSRVIAKWESRPTTLTIFWPKLNAIWSTPKTGDHFITVSVDYGGTSITLYALHFVGEKLVESGALEGRGISIENMGTPERPIVILDPPDYYLNPQLYEWNGSQLERVDRHYPEFWFKLGSQLLQSLKNPSIKSAPIPPSYLVTSCRRAIEIFDYAGRAEYGRDVCLQTRGQLLTGREVVAERMNDTPEQFQRERATAVRQIDELVARIKQRGQSKK